MIISERYRFIFIKTPCTGGSTLRDLILYHIDEHDIDLFVHDTKGIQFATSKYEVYTNLVAHDALNVVYDKVSDFDNYRIIVTLRNPYERAISLYHLYKNNIKVIDQTNDIIVKRLILYANNNGFNRWVLEVAKHMPDLFTQTQYYKVSSNDCFYTDHAIFYENYHMNVNRVLSNILDLPETEIGIVGEDGSRFIPHVAQHRPTDSPHYSEYYNEESRRLILDICSDDLENLNYSFN